MIPPILLWQQVKPSYTFCTLAGIQDTRQAGAPGDSAGRATDTHYQLLHLYTSNTHTAVQRALFHMAKCQDARINHQFGFIQLVFRLSR